ASRCARSTLVPARCSPGGRLRMLGSTKTAELDNLDRLLTSAYAGKVVRKDLLHQIKGGENVPSYVLEYLLGRYCASDDPEEIRIGIDAVKETLRTNYFRHDEANKAQSLVEQHGRHRFIDRVEVRFLPSDFTYWA